MEINIRLLAGMYSLWYCSCIHARRSSGAATCGRLMDAHNPNGIRLIDQHTGLTSAVAVILHTPICVMAETAGLTDHKIGGDEAGFKVFNLPVDTSLTAKLTTFGG